MEFFSEEEVKKKVCPFLPDGDWCKGSACMGWQLTGKFKNIDGAGIGEALGYCARALYPG